MPPNSPRASWLARAMIGSFSSASCSTNNIPMSASALEAAVSAPPPVPTLTAVLDAVAVSARDAALCLLGHILGGNIYQVMLLYQAPACCSRCCRCCGISQLLKLHHHAAVSTPGLPGTHSSHAAAWHSWRMPRSPASHLVHSNQWANGTKACAGFFARVPPH